MDATPGRAGGRLAGRRARDRRGVSHLDDGALVELARARDIDAFEELLNRHRRLICDVCVRLTFNEQDAEDAVQAVQLAVWQGIGSFEGTAKFSTWLYRVASNTTIGQVRRRVPEPTGRVPEQAAAGSLVDGRVTDVHAVRWALARLPSEFRTTLVLRECLDLSLEEIADIQIISIGTVKSRLSRARQALAALLVERAE